MNIGKNIRQRRQQKGATQEQLAEYLGVSYQAVSKWENEANTPDIQLLPKIAKFFGTSIDALFDETVPATLEADIIRDDDVIRVVQMRGKQILRVDTTFSPECPPIEIAFPRNCNDETQYFKVEVYGCLIADSAINGDVVCHQTIRCADINGSLQCAGDICANRINAYGTIVCNQIKDCYKLECNKIECAGDVASANLTANIITKICDQA